MFDTPIDVWAKAITRDEYNEVDAALTHIASCWASKVDNNGRKDVASGTIVYAEDVEYTIRWRRDVTKGQFVMDDGIRYEIVGVRAIGRRHLLRLTCKLRDD